MATDRPGIRGGNTRFPYHWAMTSSDASLPAAAPGGAIHHQLASDLQAIPAYPEAQGQGAGMRQAFERFGAECVRVGLGIEDAMAIAVSTFQDFLTRVGGGRSDSATMIAAGVALGAVGRAYAEAAPEPALIADARYDETLARLYGLHEISRAATLGLPLHDLLEIASRVATTTTGSDACAISLYDEATDSLVLRAAIGLNPGLVGTMVIRADRGITGQAAKSLAPVVVANTRQHEAWVHLPDYGDEVYSSQASIPMVLQGEGRLIGVVSILSLESRAYSPTEIALVQTIADELAITIDNAQLQQQTDETLKRKVAELGTLQRVSRTVASSLDLAHVLRLIAEAAVELIDAEAATIFRIASRVASAATDPAPSIEYRAGPVRTVVDEPGRDEMVLEVIRTGAPKAVDMNYVDGQNRLYCLPLRSARETWGALCVRLKATRELGDDDLALLQAFTDTASIAIENAQLYRDAQASVETSSVLLQEMHHRVRNNLQMVAALLSLQLRQVGDGEAAVNLRDAVSRVQAIASVHDLLSNEARLNGATVDRIVRLVVDEARVTMVPPGKQVTFDIRDGDIVLPSRQATVFALAINELISNAISHGFRSLPGGTISITCRQNGATATVEVVNDGAGVPDGFNPQESRGLGMRIVQRLVSNDLQGEFEIHSADGMTTATIWFPIEVEREDSA